MSREEKQRPATADAHRCWIECPNACYDAMAAKPAVAYDRARRENQGARQRDVLCAAIAAACGPLACNVRSSAGFLLDERFRSAITLQKRLAAVS
jgi:hypothetical protein